LADKIQYEYEIQSQVKEPSKYKVILLNDDFSTMEFVIEILMSVFRKTQEDSATLMLDVHTKGKAVCGIYTKEIATTKVAQVTFQAKKAGFPLKAILEEE
jgi:ATP-dependent Clp protease adaptor protein ClpS